MTTPSPDTVWLDKLTWPEVDSLDRQRTILTIITGCTEQQGPHLPLDSDTFFAALGLEEPTRKARAEGIPVYLLPPIPYGPAEEHMAFPGTVSISFETHHRMVKEILHSLARHGFRKLLVFEGCGGHRTLPATLEVRSELRQRGINVKIWNIDTRYAYYIAKSVFPWQPRDIHAGEFATSVTLARRPEVMRTDKLGVGRDFDGSSLPEAWFIDEVDSQGFSGDTRRASAEYGEQILQRIHTFWLEQFRRIDRVPV